MMAKPMKTLELHYPMIQFLIKLDIEWENHQLSQLEITGYRIFRPKINGMRDTQTTDNGPLFWRCTRPIKMFCCYCICGVGNMTTTTTPTPTPTLTGQILYLLLLPWDVNDSMLPENLLQEKNNNIVTVRVCLRKHWDSRETNWAVSLRTNHECQLFNNQQTLNI